LPGPPIRAALFLFSNPRNESGEAFVYSRKPQRPAKSSGKRKVAGQKMKDATDVLKIVGMILLVLIVLIFGIPLLFQLLGLTFWIVGLLAGLAVKLLYVAVVVAIVYLIIVGIRAVLK